MGRIKKESLPVKAASLLEIERSIEVLGDFVGIIIDIFLGAAAFWSAVIGWVRDNPDWLVF